MRVQAVSKSGCALRMVKRVGSGPSSASRIPLATENLLENTGWVLRPPSALPPHPLPAHLPLGAAPWYHLCMLTRAISMPSLFHRLQRLLRRRHVLGPRRRLQRQRIPEAGKRARGLPVQSPDSLTHILCGIPTALALPLSPLSRARIHVHAHTLSRTQRVILHASTC